MQETDAVSCLLCLQADEYGAMIKVCVPPGRIPPSPERVVCRLCASMIAAVLDSAPEGSPEQLELPVEQVLEGEGRGAGEGSGTDENANYVSGDKLPERET